MNYHSPIKRLAGLTAALALCLPASALSAVAAPGHGEISSGSVNSAASAEGGAGSNLSSPGDTAGSTGSDNATNSNKATSASPEKSRQARELEYESAAPNDPSTWKTSYEGRVEETTEHHSGYLYGRPIVPSNYVNPDTGKPHVCAGRKLAYHSHIDAAYATRLDGVFQVAVVDGSVVRPADTVCMRVASDAGPKDGTDAGKLVVPKSKALQFLGQPGQILWHAPSANYGAWQPIWAGHGAFDGAHEKNVPNNFQFESLELELSEFSGPGYMETFTMNLNTASRLISSRDPRHKSIRLKVDSHMHNDWVFSHPGIYHLTYRAIAQVLGENGNYSEVVSEPRTVIWLIGSDAQVGLPEGATRGLIAPQVSAEAERDKKELPEVDPGPALQPDTPGNSDNPEKPGDNGSGSDDDTPAPGEPYSRRVCGQTTPPDLGPDPATAPRGADVTSFKQTLEEMWWGFKDRPHITGGDLLFSYSLKAGQKPWENEPKWNLYPSALDSLEALPGQGDANAPSQPSASAMLVEVPDSALRHLSESAAQEVGADSSQWVWTLPAAKDGSSQDLVRFGIDLGGVDSAAVKPGSVYFTAASMSTPAEGDLLISNWKENGTWIPGLSRSTANIGALQLSVPTRKFLDVVFTRPGIYQMQEFNLQMTAPDLDYSTPASTSITFLVGNEVINAARELTGKGEALPLRGEPRPTPEPETKCFDLPGDRMYSPQEKQALLECALNGNCDGAPQVTLTPADPDSPVPPLDPPKDDPAEDGGNGSSDNNPEGDPDDDSGTNPEGNTNNDGTNPGDNDAGNNNPGGDTNNDENNNDGNNSDGNTNNGGTNSDGNSGSTAHDGSGTNSDGENTDHGTNNTDAGNTSGNNTTNQKPGKKPTIKPTISTPGAPTVIAAPTSVIPLGTTVSDTSVLPAVAPPVLFSGQLPTPALPPADVAPAGSKADSSSKSTTHPSSPTLTGTNKTTAAPLPSTASAHNPWPDRLAGALVGFGAMAFLVGVVLLIWALVRISHRRTP